MFIVTVPAGYPSPAADFVEGPLSLDQYLIHHPAATFFVRVAGDSMTGAGILSGDLLIVDRAIAPQSGSVVIAIINGELTIKRLQRQGDRVVLMPENPAYSPIPILDGMEFEIWGVVTKAIHFLH